MNFYLPNGEGLGSWEIESSNSTRMANYGLATVEAAVKIVTDRTMREVAAKFMSGFCKQEFIQKRFLDQCEL